MAPYDVLVDPLSVPSHPVFDSNRNEVEQNGDSEPPKRDSKVRFFLLWEFLKLYDTW